MACRMKGVMLKKSEAFKLKIIKQSVQLVLCVRNSLKYINSGLAISVTLYNKV